MVVFFFLLLLVAHPSFLSQMRMREALKRLMIYLKQTGSRYITQMQVMPHHLGITNPLIIERPNLLVCDQKTSQGFSESCSHKQTLN